MNESKGNGSALRLSYPKESNNDSCTLGQAIKEDKADIVLSLSLSICLFSPCFGGEITRLLRHFGSAAQPTITKLSSVLRSER